VIKMKVGEDIYSYVKKSVSPKRYNHIMRVVNLAIETAKRNKVPIEKAELAALLHDVGKELPKDEMYQIAKRGFPKEIKPRDMENEDMLHGFAGAVIAEEKLNIKDPDVLAAIKYHSIGHPHMDTLGKVVYFADKVDPKRDERYPEVKIAREIGMKDLDKGIAYNLNRMLSQWKEKKIPIHPNLLEMQKTLNKREPV